MARAHARKQRFCTLKVMINMQSWNSSNLSRRKKRNVHHPTRTPSEETMLIKKTSQKNGSRILAQIDLSHGIT